MWQSCGDSHRHAGDVSTVRCDADRRVFDRGERYTGQRGLRSSYSWSFAHSQSRCLAVGGSRDSHLHRVAYPHQNSYPGADSHVHSGPYTDCYRDASPHRDAAGRAYLNADTHTGTHRDANPYPFAHAHCHTDTHRHAYPSADAHGATHIHTHSHTHGAAHSHAAPGYVYADTDTDTDVYTRSRLCQQSESGFHRPRHRSQ